MKYRLVEENKSYLHFEITGKYSKYKGKKIIEDIFEQCVEKKVNRLMVDIRKKIGVISDWDRFFFGEFIARVFTYKVKLAVIGKKELINRFSETVAVNRGTQLFIFSEIPEALDWLLSRKE
jgi:hypothetical protein